LDRLKLLDLLYDGHSCDDCENQFFCKQKKQLCNHWNIASAEALLVKEAGREFVKEIDRYILKYPEMFRNKNDKTRSS